MASPTLSLLDPTVANDPYPFYAQLRRDAPVAPLGVMDLWGVARYHDVVRVLRDPETFSSVVGTRRLAGEELPPSMLFKRPAGAHAAARADRQGVHAARGRAATRCHRSTMPRARRGDAGEARPRHRARPGLPAAGDG